MIEKEFIKQGINQASLEEFLSNEFGRANYSHVEITKTPVSTQIIIYAQKPGLVIGRGGKRIKEVTQILKDKFGIENPEVDVQEVEEPDLDPFVVAKNIKGWIIKGGHPKRVGNTYLRRIMESGAIGALIEISGKLSGNRGRTEKFRDGYVKRCGKTSEDYVEEAYEVASTKPGTIGVKVKIMKELPAYMHRGAKIEKKLERERARKEAEKEEKEDDEKNEDNEKEKETSEGDN